MGRRIAQTKQLPLSELSFYPANPRRGDVAAIRESLERTGQYRAIVVRADSREVLAGNHTLAAMRELGWEKALCHLVDVDDETARRIVLADNRTAELASYDEEALAGLLAEMDDLQGTGWQQDAVDELLASLEPDRSGDDTEPIDPPAKPKTKPGDLYLLGEHRLLCGDATAKAHVERLMAGSTAEMVLTDPPYGVDYEGGTSARLKIANDRPRGLAELLSGALTLACAQAQPGAAAYVFHADTPGVLFRQAFATAGFELKQVLIWVKQQFVLGRQDYNWQHEPILYGWKRGTHRWYGDHAESTVLDDDVNVAKLPKAELVALIREYRERETTTVLREDRPHVSDLHPTMKPVRLCARLIANSSPRGAIILDPFAGSGSTLIACENLARRCYAMEIDPVYCDVIVDRWERHTGRKATAEKAG